jgi:hypothetical protein
VSLFVSSVECSAWFQHAYWTLAYRSMEEPAR